MSSCSSSPVREHFHLVESRLDHRRDGAALLRVLDLGPTPLLIALVAMTAMIDLLIGSASAKWAMLGPILVPMLMLLGHSPELTQTAYRVGDSLTNIITPLSSNFPLVLMFFHRYLPKAAWDQSRRRCCQFRSRIGRGAPMLVLWVWRKRRRTGAPLFTA